MEIRELRLRVDPVVVGRLTDAELESRIGRQLPAHLDPRTVAAVSSALLHRVRSAVRQQARP